MLLIALIFALAGGIWLTVMLQRGGKLAGCLLVIVTGSCLGHPFFHVSIVTLDRLLWAILLSWYAVERWRGREAATLRAGWLGGDSLLLLFLGVLTCSTFSHDWRVEGAQPASRLLFLYLLPAGLYWVARHTAVTPTAMRNLALSGCLFGLYLACTGLAEVTGLRALVFPRYIVSAEFPEFLGRARGPYLNPSANGIYLGTGLAACWGYWQASTGRVRTGWLAVAGLVCAGGLATLTRCVWLGFILSTLLLLWLHAPRRQSLGATLLLGSLGIVLLAVGWDNLVAFKRDKNVSVADMKESAKLRPMLAAVAWQIFQDAPLQGVGYGQYKQVDQHYIAQRDFDMPLDKVRPYHQHNVILSLLTETGLVGTLPFLALLAVWSRTAFRVWRQAEQSWWLRMAAILFLVCLTNYLANGMFQDVALIPMVNLLLFFLAGVLMSVAADMSVVPASRHSWFSWRNLYLRRQPARYATGWQHGARSTRALSLPFTAQPPRTESNGCPNPA